MTLDRQSNLAITDGSDLKPEHGSMALVSSGQAQNPGFPSVGPSVGHTALIPR